MDIRFFVIPSLVLLTGLCGRCAAQDPAPETTDPSDLRLMRIFDLQRERLQAEIDRLRARRAELEKERAETEARRDALEQRIRKLETQIDTATPPADPPGRYVALVDAVLTAADGTTVNIEPLTVVDRPPFKEGDPFQIRYDGVLYRAEASRFAWSDRLLRHLNGRAAKLEAERQKENEQRARALDRQHARHQEAADLAAALEQQRRAGAPAPITVTGEDGARNALSPDQVRARIDADEAEAGQAAREAALANARAGQLAADAERARVALKCVRDALAKTAGEVEP